VILATVFSTSRLLLSFLSTCPQRAFTQDHCTPLDVAAEYGISKAVDVLTSEVAFLHSPEASVAADLRAAGTPSSATGDRPFDVLVEWCISEDVVLRLLQDFPSLVQSVSALPISESLSKHFPNKIGFQFNRSCSPLLSSRLSRPSALC
jgi:hypothetical protein